MVRPPQYQYKEFDRNNSFFQLFYHSIKSPVTRELWTNFLHNYMASQKMKTYDELIPCIPNTTPPAPDVRLIQARLTSYINDLKIKGIRSQSIGGKLTGIRHFYWINEIDDIKWDRVRSFLGESIKAVNDKAYTHEQIAQFLTFADYRMKVVILTQSSTAVRIGAVAVLKFGDLTWVPDYSLYSFRVYNHTPSAYTTFCTPECAKAINDYMAYRQQFGEEITAESPLIRDQFNEKKAKEARPATLKTIQALIYRTAIKAGLRTREKGQYSKRRENMLTHGLRKFAKKNMRKSGVDPIIIEYLMGHKSGDVTQGVTRLMMTYDPSEDNELLSEYLKAVNMLTINEEYRLKIALTAEQIKRQEEEKKNEFMRNELDEIKRMIRASRPNKEEREIG